jgi:hypothetical protein
VANGNNTADIGFEQQIWATARFVRVGNGKITVSFDKARRYSCSQMRLLMDFYEQSNIGGVINGK